VDIVAISGSSGDGITTFCAVPAGTPGGTWLGTYHYNYGKEGSTQMEYGNYGTNPIGFWAESGVGFVCNWFASTGKYAGSFGSGLYMTVGSDTDTVVTVGFYCFVDEVTLERLECHSEYYDVVKSDRNTENCPYDYRLDGTLDALYEFAAVGSGNANEEESSSKTLSSVGIIAIVFGGFSGVLLLLLVRRYMRAAQKTSSSTAPSR
jgi:hypothetical protein